MKCPNTEDCGQTKQFSIYRRYLIRHDVFHKHVSYEPADSEVVSRGEVVMVCCTVCGCEGPPERFGYNNDSPTLFSVVAC